MAKQTAPVYSQAEGNDYAEHEKTYKLFVGLTKWGIISLTLLMIVMALTLV